MERVKTLFFDSYALYEIIEGNENYKQYTRNTAIVTTKLNLMELHYGLLRQYGKNQADRCYDELVRYTVDIGDDIIKMANEFRASLRKRNLSYVDCIGYIIARAMSINFLTGDMQFRDIDNVEYVV